MVRNERFRPTSQRVYLAFAIVPLASSCVLGFVTAASFALANGIVFSGLGGDLWRAVFFVGASALFGTYPLTMLFGVPIYWMLIGRTGSGPWSPVIVGCFIGVVPWLALVALTNRHNTPGLGILGTFTGMGIVGGLVFWTIAVWRDPRRKPDPRLA